MRHLVYAISITAVFIVPVAATNYYVTHPGAGNRKGTSLSNAWSVTDLNDSANWSSTENASKIDPGDVVYFCRQVVARHQNCYVAGNSGPNDLKKTTLASSPFKESGCRDRLTRDRFSGERGGIGREEPEGASSRRKE